MAVDSYCWINSSLDKQFDAEMASEMQRVHVSVRQVGENQPMRAKSFDKTRACAANPQRHRKVLK